MQERGLSEDYIRELYYSEMNAMKYDKGEGYVFLISRDGKMLLNPNLPQLNGTNQMSLKDTHGFLWVKRVIEVALTPDEKYLAQYFLPKPGSSQAVEKLSYARYFEPLDIVVATGLYFDNVQIARDALIKKTQ